MPILFAKNLNNKIKFLKSNNKKLNFLKIYTYLNTDLVGPESISAGFGTLSTSPLIKAVNEGNSILYYTHQGCGTCSQLRYNITLNRFEYNNTSTDLYIKSGFNSILTNNNWVRLSDNQIINMVFGSQSVQILRA